jgi:hypothetical protein
MGIRTLRGIKGVPAKPQVSSKCGDTSVYE